MLTYPKVTVVTVCYNVVTEIEKTILSVINQMYPNIEYIIIDGASTDGTLDVIKRFDDKITKWISEPDKGIYDAMNKGIRLATGQWINFMNAGDYFHSNDAISNIFGQVKIADNIKGIYGDIIAVRKTGSTHEIALPTVKIKDRMPCSHQALFMSLEEPFQFDMKWNCASEYATLLDFYYKFGEKAFLHVPVIICDFEASYGISSLTPVTVFKQCIDIRSSHKDLYWYWDYLKYFVKRWIFFKK